jgi:hypothetical protein
MAENEISTTPGVASAEITVNLSWDNVDQLSTIYANQMYITHGGKEFYLVFGEVVTPLFFDVPSGSSVTLPVKQLVRVAVSFESMLEFTKTINQNVARFIQTQQEAQSSEDKE